MGRIPLLFNRRPLCQSSKEIYLVGASTCSPTFCRPLHGRPHHIRPCFFIDLFIVESCVSSTSLLAIRISHSLFLCAFYALRTPNGYQSHSRIGLFICAPRRVSENAITVGSAPAMPWNHVHHSILVLVIFFDWVVRRPLLHYRSTSPSLSFDLSLARSSISIDLRLSSPSTSSSLSFDLSLARSSISIDLRLSSPSTSSSLSFALTLARSSISVDLRF